jgi:hypothetical protein
MTANSKDEKPSSETRKLDPTLIAKPYQPNLPEGGGTFGSGAGGAGGIGTLGSPGGGPAGGGSGRGNVGGIGSSNSGGVSSGVSPGGGLNGFGSTRGTGNSGGVGIKGGGVPVHSTGYSSGSSSTTQPKKPQQPKKQSTEKSTAQQRSQPQTPKSNPALDYLNIPASQNPNDAVVDRALREVRKNPTPRPSRKRQRTQPEGNPFISSPLPPTKITRPKRRKDNPSIEIPKQKDPLTEIIPAFPETDPFNRTIPTVPRKDPFTNATPNVRVVPQQDPFTNATPNVRVVPQQDPFTNATSNVRGYPLDDQRYPNPFSTTPNPNKPSRNRRNPKKPDILRVNNRPEVEELYRKNPLIPTQKPNPNSVTPGKITSPNIGGQPIQAKKTPGNGNSQNSNSGGNSSQQQPTTKKQKKDLAKKYAGRDIDKLTAAEEKEFKQGYIISNDKGKKYIKRRSEADDYPQMHLADVNGKQVIAEGPSPSNRGNSNPSTMKREYKAKFGQDAPKGDDIHHLVPVNVWQEDPIVKALEKKGEKEQKPVAGVDDGNGLISVPSNSNAMEDTHQNLEQKGGRVKIAHPSSHTKWDEHVKDLSREEQRKLLRNSKYKKLEDVPIEKLEKSIDNIRQQLRKDLQNAAKQIEKGNYNNLPNWIDPKYQLKPDPKKAPPSQNKQYPRLVEKPTNKDIAEFRKTLTALKAKVGQGIQKHELYNNRTNLNADERQFRALGYSAMLAVKNNNGYSAGQPFVFQHKGSEVGIYRRGDYTQVATIDLQQGVISVDKPFNSVEDNWLAEQQKVVLAQAQETHKTPAKESRGFEIG